jgi:lipopolysaccharide/colanic/teichoic acid biosynthesis glycosyltransferase
MMNQNKTFGSEAVIRPRKKNRTGSRQSGFFPAAAEIHHAPSLPPRRADARLKRSIDVTLAALLFVATLPIMLLAGLLVRLTSKGPAIYTQTRLGLRGAEFKIFKIRTMIDNCESLTGPRWALPGDPRVTPVGAVLRATHLDELPQLWNVLRGDMSLIGPRPERPEIVAKLLRDLPNYRDRLEVRPGITGLAQVQLPPDVNVSTAADKLVLDCAYIERMSIWLDARLLVCTAMKLLGLGSKRSRFLVHHAIPLGFTPGANIPRPRRVA